MPLDALQTIKDFESSGGQNVKQGVVDSSISSASGFYQITNTTWNGTIAPAINAPKVGPGTANPNGVMDLSESVQTQGASYLFSTQGFQPWTCDKCNPALRDYVASQGGASAFGLIGDSSSTGTDVTGAGSTGLPDVSFTAADGSSSAAAMPAVSDTPGPLSKPFTWLYNQTITATQEIVFSDITAMQTAVGAYGDPLLILALVVLGIRSLMGRYSIDQYARYVLSVSFVVAFVAVGSTFYETYIIDPVVGLPAWWQGYLATGNGVQLSGNSPAAMLDAVYNHVIHVIIEVWKATPLSFGMVFIAVALGAAWVVVAFSLLAVFMAFAITTLLVLILLIIGPIMIPFVLFQFTAPFFYGWARATITLVLSMLAIDIILTMFLSIMTNLMSALSITGTPETDLPSVWGCTLALAIMGYSVKYVPSLIAMIGGGVAVSLNSVSRQMSGAAITSVAMAPVNAARRFVGMR